MDLTDYINVVLVCRSIKEGLQTCMQKHCYWNKSIVCTSECKIKHRTGKEKVKFCQRSYTWREGVVLPPGQPPLTTTTILTHFAVLPYGDWMDSIPVGALAQLIPTNTRMRTSIRPTRHPCGTVCWISFLGPHYVCSHWFRVPLVFVNSTTQMGLCCLKVTATCKKRANAATRDECREEDRGEETKRKCERNKSNINKKSQLRIYCWLCFELTDGNQKMNVLLSCWFPSTCVNKVLFSLLFLH